MTGTNLIFYAFKEPRVTGGAVYGGSVDWMKWVAIWNGNGVMQCVCKCVSECVNALPVV